MIINILLPNDPLVKPWSLICFEWQPTVNPARYSYTPPQVGTALNFLSWFTDAQKSTFISSQSNLFFLNILWSHKVLLDLWKTVSCTLNTHTRTHPQLASKYMPLLSCFRCKNIGFSCPQWVKRLCSSKKKKKKLSQKIKNKCKTVYSFAFILFCFKKNFVLQFCFKNTSLFTRFCWITFIHFLINLNLITQWQHVFAQ